MKTPLVSICLPNLNTRPFLTERMETVLAQTVQDWELIICDGYSDDGAWEFFQKFKSDPRIRMAQLPRGEFQAWNWCMRQAKGEYIYIATSDDTMSPTLIESLVAPLRLLPEVSLASCDFQEIDKDGQPLDRQHVIRDCFGEWIHIPSIRNGKTEFLLHSCLGPTWVTMTAVLFRRRLLDQGMWFRTDQGAVADVEWAMRASLASDIAFVPGRLATWRVHDKQASPKQRSRAILRTLMGALEAVLRDERSGISEGWKAIRGWDREIMQVWRSQYLNSFDLYRGVAKREPKRFLQNAWRTLREEPRFLLSQALHGFTQPIEKFELDPGTVAKHLIRLFNSPWPPQKVTLPTWR